MKHDVARVCLLWLWLLQMLGWVKSIGVAQIPGRGGLVRVSITIMVQLVILLLQGLLFLSFEK